MSNFTGESMNHERVSQICFDEAYVVPSHQTARALFMRLPHGQEYADSLIECFATGYLVAVIESICIEEMRHHVNQLEEVVVGRSIRLDHRGAVPSGTSIRVSGWIDGMGTRSATFFVRAHDDHELVCEGHVTLVAADRRALESRIADKVNPLPGGDERSHAE